MKKLIFIFLIILSSNIIAKSDFYINSSTGINLAYPKAPLNRMWGLSYTLGLGFGYNLSNDISAEILYQYNKHALDAFYREGGGIFYFINSYFIKLNYKLTNFSDWHLFISIGIGLSNLEIAKERSNNVVSFFPGIGFKYALSDKFAIKFFSELAVIDKKILADEKFKCLPIQLGIEYKF